MFWLLGFIAGFFVGGMVEDAGASYRPVAAVQDEAAISCGSLKSRQRGLEVARDLGATRIRINAIQNMNPLFGCDPIAAARAANAAGFSVHITLQGTPGWARYIDRAVGPLVDVWSTWNEPNHTDFHFGPMAAAMPRTYRKLHVRVAKTLRKVDPGSKVLIGELAPNTVHESKWLGKVVHSRKRPVYVDGIAVHAYPWFGDPDSADPKGMRGYLRVWKAHARTWARERRLCRSAVGSHRGRKRYHQGCRPVPIYVTEAGYMRELQVLWGAPVYDTPMTADRLVRSWRVACQEKVRQMFHYQLLVAHQPRWDTSLIGDYGPRPEFSVLKGYLATAQGCRGTRGPLGQEHGPPPAPVVPPVDHVPVQISPPLPPLPPGVPDDVPVVVEPVPEVEPTPPVVELPGPPEPAVEPPVAPEPAAEEPVPVEPPIQEGTP